MLSALAFNYARACSSAPRNSIVTCRLCADARARLVTGRGIGARVFAGEMKYGKLLQVLLEQMPVEYRDKFLSYKQLKKVINTILQDNSLPAAAFVEVSAPEGEEGAVEGVEPAVKRARGEQGVSGATGAEVRGGDGGSVAAGVGAKRKAGEVEGESAAGVNVAGGEESVAVRGKGGEEKELTKEEENFLHLLNKELEKFNSFFTEKEEDYVIRLQELKNVLENLRQEGDGFVHPSDRTDDLMTIRIDLVTLHGELILMESYSTLNYTGLVKILKKHDKRTGAVLRLPFIRRVLLQPFFSTELLSQLVKECSNLLSTFPPTFPEIIEGPGDVPSDRPYATGPIAEGIFKGTVAALRTIQEMRKGSSTVSPLSLPPCDLSRTEDRCGVDFKENPRSIKFSDYSRIQEPESMSCAS